MIFVKNSRGGREVNIVKTVSKINLSKIEWEANATLNPIPKGGENRNLIFKSRVFPGSTLST